MNRDLKCDICNGLDYSELSTCHICKRNYCELCDGEHDVFDTCELCGSYSVAEE